LLGKRDKLWWPLIYNNHKIENWSMDLHFICYVEWQGGIAFRNIPKNIHSKVSHSWKKNFDLIFLSYSMFATGVNIINMWWIWPLDCGLRYDGKITSNKKIGMTSCSKVTRNHICNVQDNINKNNLFKKMEQSIKFSCISTPYLWLNNNFDSITMDFVS
jgi:hypothetical protein